jgi:hypothetical protein
VIVRCTTWLAPDAGEDADEDADADGDEDEPELQAASASATAVAAPAVTAPRFENGLLTFVFSLDRRSGFGPRPFSLGSGNALSKMRTLGSGHAAVRWRPGR